MGVNRVGSDSTTTQMKIYGAKTPTRYKAAIRNRRLLTLLNRPYRVAIGTNMTSRAGNTLLLECPITKNDEVKIFWLKDGERVDNIGPGQRHRHRTGQSLLLQKVTRKENGKYTCISDDPA